MHKVQFTSNPINSQVFSAYIYRMVTLVGFIISFLISHSSYALATNPGATCQGITGASQGSLLNTDYNSLVSAVNTDNYVTIGGNASGSIPLQIKISTTESSSSTIANNLSVISPNVNGANTSAINVNRDFPSPLDFTNIVMDFRNVITAQPIYLSNVAISAFDVDYASSNNNLFDDFIQITGTTQAGTTITGTFQSIAGSNVINANGLNNGTATNCPAKNLDTRCQGSIQFTQPVSKVTIRYTNNPDFVTRTPTNQEIDFRVDNYCYVPQYIFSGTVFDDNGGITGTRANATNADITTSTSPYANNSNYFNGIFNTSAPNAETGITGSTVKLVNCANNSTTYTTQSVIRDNAPLGEYQISIPKTTLANNTNLCLLESRTGNTYPIRTSNESNNVGFAANIYNYPNNNFGRVIAENAALVLRKAQYVNNCPSTIPYTDPALNAVGEPNLRNGFSESANNGNALTPGQCIAYRITATNRANVPITNFVMQDKLQSKSDGAAVTSTLANPVASTTDYASNSVAIGNNGTVTTNPFTLNARSNRNFYFNTKYGTTVNAQ